MGVKLERRGPPQQQDGAAELRAAQGEVPLSERAKARTRHRAVSMEAARWIRETRSDWLTLGASVLEIPIVPAKA